MLKLCRSVRSLESAWAFSYSSHTSGRCNNITELLLLCHKARINKQQYYFHRNIQLWSNMYINPFILLIAYVTLFCWGDTGRAGTYLLFRFVCSRWVGLAVICRSDADGGERLVSKGPCSPWHEGLRHKPDVLLIRHCPSANPLTTQPHQPPTATIYELNNMCW